MGELARKTGDVEPNTERTTPLLSMEAAEATAIAAISSYLGVPLPPTFARNVIAATSALVVAALSVPTAWLEGLTRAIRAKADAEADVVTGTVPLVLDTIAEDADFKRRATIHLTGKMLREQGNREAIARQTMSLFKSAPPKEDASGLIDDDWLDLFSRHAATKSNEEIQAYLARILEGEIRKPGSFSPGTIEVLSRLTPDVARLFQRFCNASSDFGPRHSPALLAAPFGWPNANSLAPIGFDYSTLYRLADAGLIRPSFDSHRSMATIALALIPFSVGGMEIRLAHDLPAEEVAARAKNSEKLPTLFFTTAGEELRRIVHMQPDSAYVAQFFEWARKNGMRPA